MLKKIEIDKVDSIFYKRWKRTYEINLKMFEKVEILDEVVKLVQSSSEIVLNKKFLMINLKRLQSA